MTISFNEVPSPWRAPFTFIEFDNSGAVQGPSAQAFKQLIFGQMLPTGTAEVLVPVRVINVSRAEELFGKGSMLHGMFKALFKNNAVTEVFAMPMIDLVAGAKATGSLQFVGTATKAGIAAVYIAGRKISVGISSGDTATVIVTKAITAINAITDMPVTAVVNVDPEIIDLEFDHKGEVGNEIDIRVGYYSDEKVLPAGVTSVIVPFSGGAGNPDITLAIAALPDTQYNVMSFPYRDTANLVALEDELLTRWGAGKQLEGHAVIAHNGTHTEMGTFGDSRNSKHISIIDAHKSPTPTYEWAAATMGVLAFNLSLDQSRPLQTLEIKAVLSEELKDEFKIEERNLLLFDGISTHFVDAGGRVRIERMITTYKVNELGADDISYLDVNTLFTLSFLRYDLRNYIMRKYPRHKLANDGGRYSPGQKIMTPKLAKAEAIAKYREWEGLGHVENFEAFKEGLIVERSATDPNRLEWKITPDLMNQLRVNAIQIAFLL